MVRSDVSEFLRAVLSKYGMSEEEYKRLLSLANRLRKELEDIIREVYGPVGVKARIAGSISRRTSLNTEFDVDIFVVHPRSFSFSEISDLFEKAALKFYKRYNVVPVREYAAHPYFKGTIGEKDIRITVEIIPCFEWKPGEKVKSPVDRSIEHNKWLNSVYMRESRTRDLAVALKVFFKSLGIYGAEARVGGFSGYLTELLAVYYRDLIRALKDMRSWKSRRVMLSFKEMASKRTHELIKERPSMIFLDPVDPDRNAAAAVREGSIRTLCEAANEAISLIEEGDFEELSRMFSLEYDESFIERQIMSLFRSNMKDLFMLELPKELCNLHPDVLYTELMRTAEGVKDKLASFGINAECFIDYKNARVFLRITKPSDGTVIRLGPYANMIRDEIKFLKRNLHKDDALILAFCGERWYVLKRAFTNIMEFLHRVIKESTHGKDIREYIAKGKYRILHGKDAYKAITSLDVEEKAKFLIFYLKIKPWMVRKPWSTR